MTVSPTRRYRGRQPQKRYALTTSHTKRFSEPAHVSHGKPSLRAAWTMSSAVCSSQPTRTPQVAQRVYRGEEYANAASPYPISAGQKSSSSIVEGPLPGELDEVA